jgi:hypothetical protein
MWVMGLILLLDGYGLVVYGACLSTFLRDPHATRRRHAGEA